MIRLNKTAVQATNYETNIRPIATFSNVSVFLLIEVKYENNFFL